MSPWIGVPVTLAAFGIAFAAGWDSGRDHAARAALAAAQHQAQQQQAATQIVEQAQATVETRAAVVTAEREAVTRIQTREVIRYVETHAAADCGLDADGLRLWRAANAGVDPAALAAIGADAALPGAAATGRPTAAAVARQPRGGGAAVPAVPGAAGGAGGLGAAVSGRRP